MGEVKVEGELRVGGRKSQKERGRAPWLGASRGQRARADRVMLPGASRVPSSGLWSPIWHRDLPAWRRRQRAWKAQRGIRPYLPFLPHSSINTFDAAPARFGLGSCGPRTVNLRRPPVDWLIAFCTLCERPVSFSRASHGMLPKPIHALPAALPTLAYSSTTLLTETI